MTQSEPPSKFFRRLSRRAAEDHFRSYVETQEQRLEAFESLVRARGGPQLNGSEESMRQLGAWLMGVLGEGPRDAAEAPIWAPTGDDFPGRLSSESLQLLDGTALYFANVLRLRHRHLQWVLASDRTIDDYQQPVLEGFGLTRLPPLVPIMFVFNARLSQPQDTDWLARLFRFWDETARQAASGAAPEHDESIDDVDITAIEGDPKWDVEIWIPENAEHVLGEDGFRLLPERIEAIDGIERLAWEDRERFLAKVAKGVDLSELKARVAEVVRQAEAAGQAARD